MDEVLKLPARALVADIGGTNARFALADLDTLALSDIRQLRCADHRSLEAALADYLGGLSVAPDRAVIAVAGPVTGAEISLTNSTWSIAKQDVAPPVRLQRRPRAQRLRGARPVAAASRRRRPSSNRRRRAGRACDQGWCLAPAPGSASPGWCGRQPAGSRCRARAGICRSAPRTSGNSRCSNGCARAETISPPSAPCRGRALPSSTRRWPPRIGSARSRCQPNDVIERGMSGEG